MLLLLIFSCVLIVSCVCTRYMIHYSHSHHIIDQPNHRSLHTLPIPRGGGIAFVLSILISLPIIYWIVPDLPNGTFGLFSIVAVITLIGFLDDCYNLSSARRLIIYAVCSAAAIYFLGLTSDFSIYYVKLFWIKPLIACLYLLWMVNLYNFMDGINGLAACEAICVCCGASCLYIMIGHYEMIYLPLIISAAVIGFLVWNFPLARIFMGDAGSCALGMLLGGLSIQAAAIMPDLFWSWFILMGVFIVDSTYTLFVRVAQGINISQAHCSHAYQHAALRFGHSRVTLAVVLLNITWLLPIAIGVTMKYSKPLLSIIVAYIPLILIAVGLRAGTSIHRDAISD